MSGREILLDPCCGVCRWTGKQAALRPTAPHPRSQPRPLPRGPRVPSARHPQVGLVGQGCSRQHRRVNWRLSVPGSLLSREPRGVCLLVEVMEYPGLQHWDGQPWPRRCSWGPSWGPALLHKAGGFFNLLHAQVLAPCLVLQGSSMEFMSLSRGDFGFQWPGQPGGISGHGKEPCCLPWPLPTPAQASRRNEQQWPYPPATATIWRRIRAKEGCDSCHPASLRQPGKIPLLQ